ncbi:MAG: sn-glycerol-3-phosphate ABC transporter ATP-binding protein UgpC [Candidatus Bipolaricaulota bacterium]|nr:ABC transporter ATP-binding protein [Candidatus Bipolaricaulota bacterium]
MGLVDLRCVAKAFGPVVAVDRVSLSIEKGEFVALLGPSGCGKTTTLRMIAGLEVPDDGEIHLAGRRVFSAQERIVVPPQRRNVGMVFQSYALWPHMTVFENVAFGLRVQRKPRSVIRSEVRTVLAYMQLEDLERRYPHELSGGQQQRVALARMIVARPAVFLMDEPLSNLDAKLRTEMRAELKRLHRDLTATTVYVTHDQLEALTLASRIVVMKDGTIQQDAAPSTLYERPANLFVAEFVGSYPVNLIEGRLAVEHGRACFVHPEVVVPTEGPPSATGEELMLAIRPEDVVLVPGEVPPPAGEGGCLTATVKAVFPAGRESTAHVDVGGRTWTVVFGKGIAIEVGDRVNLFLPSARILLYRRDTGELVRERSAGP